MRPDAINPTLAHDAVRLLRASEVPHNVDDETLANLIEHGIGSVAPHDRAPLLRAIGNSPEIAAVVADLAPAASAEQASAPAPLVLGLRASTWRAAWAACAMLAVAGTAWIVTSPDPSGIELLDGGVDSPAQDFADSFSQMLRRSTVVILWVSLAALTVPAFLAGPRDAQGRPALERRRSTH